MSARFRKTETPREICISTHTINATNPPSSCPSQLVTILVSLVSYAATSSSAARRNIASHPNSHPLHHSSKLSAPSLRTHAAPNHLQRAQSTTARSHSSSTAAAALADLTFAGATSATPSICVRAESRRLDIFCGQTEERTSRRT